MSTSLDILHVDDEPHMLHLVREAFEESPTPTHVRGVGSGREALELLTGEAPTEDAFDPDLVVLDENLGRESGLDLLEELRDHVPDESSFVMLTGSNDPAAVDLAYERGANAFVEKPGDFEGLVSFARGATTFWEPGSAPNASA